MFEIRRSVALGAMAISFVTCYVYVYVELIDYGRLLPFVLYYSEIEQASWSGLNEIVALRQGWDEVGWMDRAEKVKQ